MSDTMKTKIATIFNDIADAVESGEFGKKLKIGLTILGSEHAPEELVKGAEAAVAKYSDLEVVLFGEGVETALQLIPASNLEECHHSMEKALSERSIDGCVTLHYNFPFGVSTVGRVVTPGCGKEMIIATTTGSSDTDRVNGMIMNTIYGISIAKSLGINSPTIGILNIDGANPVGRKLKELKTNGYNINFAESARADGGITMRGNDLLRGTPDIMICDTLTGNLLMKVFSSYTTGGSFESMGYGYGPGIGENYESTISIISRASGAPVICNAIRYTADVIKGNIHTCLDDEISSAKQAGLNEILTIAKEEKSIDITIECPTKKIVSEQIPGIDILEIEDAKEKLWSEGIYAETGMGCTGPIIIIAQEDLVNARVHLKKAKYID